MASLSVAEADNHLSELIDRALSGDRIVITRHGRPAVELCPVQAEAEPASDQPAGKLVSLGDLDWLAAERAKDPLPSVDAGTEVSRMRDDWAR